MDSLAAFLPDIPEALTTGGVNRLFMANLPGYDVSLHEVPGEVERKTRVARPSCAAHLMLQLGLAIARQ